MKEALEEILQEINPALKLKDFEELTGGSINTAVKVTTNSETFFIKYNKKYFYENLRCEVQNLELIKSFQIINTPQIFQCGQTENYSFLALEYIQVAPNSFHSIRYLAEKMAELHHILSSYSGLGYNNFIGPFKQDNKPTKSWVKFFLEKRLNPMIQKSIENKLLDTDTYKIFESYQFHKQVKNILFSDGNTLLHGDFWNGNIVYTKKEAYLIDPACYYGSREVDIAFSKLFGGLNSMFYDIYQNLLPYQHQYEKRFAIYNLYPFLIHLNLFGKQYLKNIKSLLTKIISLY